MIYLKKVLIHIFKLNKNPLYRNNYLIKVISDLNLMKKVSLKLKNGQEKKIHSKILLCLKKQLLEKNYKWIDLTLVENKKLFYFKIFIIQALLIIVLNTVYEPSFQKLEYNYGFRYKKSIQKMVQKWKKQNQKWVYLYKVRSRININHNILLSILKKKIIDPIFLDLMFYLFKNNLFFKNVHLNFIFHNIYAHEFDLYLSYKIKTLKNQYKRNFYINKINLKLFQSTLFLKIYFKKKLIYWSRILERIDKFIFNTFWKLKNFLKEKKKNQMAFYIKILRQKRLQIIYTRYYDSWLIFSSYTLPWVKQMKNKLSKWVKKKLKLFENKISISHLIKNKLNYLGFTVSYNTSKIKQIDYPGNVLGKLKKSHILFIGVDHKYLWSKLKRKKVISIKHKINSIIKYVNLTIFQIFNKFRKKINKLKNYYFKVLSSISSLKYYIYIYKMSFSKTLARKTNKINKHLKTKFLQYLKKWNIAKRKGYRFWYDHSKVRILLFQKNN